jgi:ribonuclease HII
MLKLDEEFPAFNWKKNMGYPTQEHREAIYKFGATKQHRMTFKLLPDPIQLSMF